MATKKVFLALAAAGLLSLGAFAPAIAQDDPGMSGDEGAGVEVPADPDSMDSGMDPGTEEGTGDAGDADAGSGDAGSSEPQPE